MTDKYGIGKKRSKLGKWLDERGINQQWLVKEANVSKDTISKLCKDDDASDSITFKTARKVLKAIRKIDPAVKVDDFWKL